MTIRHTATDAAVLLAELHSVHHAQVTVPALHTDHAGAFTTISALKGPSGVTKVTDHVAGPVIPILKTLPVAVVSVEAKNDTSSTLGQLYPHVPTNDAELIVPVPDVRR